MLVRKTMLKPTDEQKKCKKVEKNGFNMVLINTFISTVP